MGTATHSTPAADGCKIISLSAERARRAKALPAPPPHPLTLSFVTKKRPGRRGGGCDYWSVKSSGNYAVDHAFGDELAREYLSFIGKNPTVGNATLLTCIVGDMVAKYAAAGKLDAIAQTFLSRVNEAALVSSFFGCDNERA